MLYWLVRCVLFFGMLLCFFSPEAPAETWYPGPDWKDAPDPVASPYAVPGGRMDIFGGQYPKSLNYYLDNNTLSAEVFSAMYETLLSLDPRTMEYIPAVAKRWSISDDKKTFTFILDERAKWSDGKPISVADVAWTFQAVTDPENLTGPHKVALERFQPPVIVNKNTIRFTAENVHWNNLGAAGGFHILPRHVFEEKDFNKVNFAFPAVSGPYRLGKIEEGNYIELVRRDQWWGWRFERSRGSGNFEALRFKFFAERENAFEAFKQGRIDLYPIYTSRIWMNETGGEPFRKAWIVKQKIYNKNPIGFQGFAMNMRTSPFTDVRVRKAMALLLDREKMNNTLMYGQYFLHRSYYEDLYGPKHPCPNPLIKMNKEAAAKLLTEAGWKPNPETGLREKNGTPFSFKFLTRSATSDMFLSIYKEDLKDAGVELIIDRKDWAAWVRDMQAYNFQMTWAAWSSGVFKDPEGMWSSKEAERPGSNNVAGFKDDRVDALIEKQKTIFDLQKRNEILREIDQIVFNAYPYVLLWNIDYTRLLYWNKFGTPETVLSKYGDERSAYWYWWLDWDLAAELEHARDNNLSMPKHPAVVHFHEAFTP